MEKTLLHFENIKQNVIQDMEKLTTVINKYDKMTNIVSKMNLDKKQDTNKTLCEIVLEHRNQISDGKFNILVLGEFSCGKSTFLNALIKDKILPVSVKPTTATINTISYSENKKVTLQFWGPIDEKTGKETKKGGTKNIDISDLKSHTTSLTDEADEISKKTKVVNIFYPTEYCKNSITIVDTPGFNSVHSYHDNVTLNYLMNGNAIIWLLNPLQPLSGSEREYLRKAKHYISKILFVVPKIDLLDDEDRAEVWDIFKSDIPKETNTDEKINLYPINAKLAANGDWETSNFQEFITELEKFLWSDSKTQEMLSPGILNSISIIDSIKNNIELSLNGLTFSPEEFQKRINENLPKLERIKKRHSEIIQFINDRHTLLINRIEVEMPKIINQYLQRISDLILSWVFELEDLKRQLPGILKENMMDIYSKIEEPVNEEISYIRNETNSRYQDIALDMMEYQLSISKVDTKLTKNDISGKFDNAVLLGGNLFLGAIIGGFLAGPFMLVAAFAGGNLFSEFLVNRQKQKRLIEVEKLVITNLKKEFYDQFPKISNSVGKTLHSFTDDVNAQISGLLNSVYETIESIKKEQSSEKNKIENRIVKFNTFETDFEEIEKSLRLSLERLN